MKKQKTRRDLLTLSFLTLLTVITWIGFDVYRALVKYTIPEILDQQMKPLNPKLDQETIDRLKERLVVTEEEMVSIPLVKERVEEDILEEVLESTESATVSGQTENEN